MFRLLTVLIFFMSSSTVSVFSQTSVYKDVDSIMRSYSEKIRSSDELYKVVYFIRNTFEADSLRLRASFIWITENIVYDIEGFQKDDPRSSLLDFVIKNKKAVCGGYASLLKFFCNAFNIESEIIYGVARGRKNDIDISKYNLRSNHAWNAVKINNNWRLVDPTWAAGSVDDTNDDKWRYYKEFKEEYYFTPPERMVFNHHPDQYKFQFLSKTVFREKFKKWPLFTTQFVRDSIVLIFPDTALIRGKVGDTVSFRIKTNFTPGKIYFKTEKLEKADYTVDVKRKGEWIEFFYPLKISGNYIIYLGYQSVLHTYPALVAYKCEVQMVSNKQD